MTAPTVPPQRAGSRPTRIPGSDERPAVNPALRRLWRGPGSLQLGVDPRRARIVDGLQACDERLLELLDGTRTVSAAASLAGCDLERAQALVAALRDARALTPAATGSGGDLAVPGALLPDAAAASLQHPDDTGAAVILRRSLRRVDVVGCGRVGATLANLLAAAGVGAVRCVDPGVARASDTAPGGLPASLAGARREEAAGRRVAAVQAQPPPRGWPPHPDLVVLAPIGPVTPPEAAAGITDLPHLEVVVRETRALVGPLVLPGRTACRRCAELARADRDPAWPLLTAQLAAERRGADPCDLALAATAAGLAGLHVLRWLDHESRPVGAAGAPPPHPLANAVVELCGETGAIRRRAVAAHPDCGCAAAE